ncbi:putative disease resistance protein RGA4 [Phragmites australis]|uniref:putative disease resistance protein RGA4 n=1 Tax=Phragmites australis TaxID=29695 RepID=UPI002D787867|nr:putative disease resistance protein RGA4 [Phragmites australis]XP_062218777.1 putative disease resistance protein RGA4 [Phragmites australis]XP_062218778.1 putative disease resistance protein RGA4 [Phragmites australis]XP_062218779.1 putative disease resistance protein RGA4 [Phragmites australis]XP_062218780.1 putative disease resistance protein RGA4 [Phragmites australis]XP_062218782.1 putative disease resistance protein RGA4 [Phragmites australis]XP_062218783.1 putative disease resistanc
MEAAVGAASWLLGKVLNKLSDDLVAAYVSSSELNLNFQKIKRDLMYTQGLLHEAQGGDVTFNLGLRGLLEDLGQKADEAEDALDELHYFMIQDKLDGTREAAPDVGDGLSSQTLHARHAVQHTAGNWFSCFPCCRSQDDIAVVTDNTSKAESDINIDDGRVDKVPFNRVDMSNKIKQVIEEINSLCPPISDLLKINLSSNLQPSMPASTKRPVTSSEITQRKLFGRDAIYEKTINEMTNATQNDKILSVLPIVGPGGIGKTTFAQHLYNDKRTEEHFIVRVWVCVSTNFDVLKLTKEILGCLPATENEGNKKENETTNLDRLQKTIAERLKSKRFLVVLDDIWECSSDDDWGKLLAPFEKGETSGNMVLVTTRFPKIVEMVTKGTSSIDLHGLDPDAFWKFFQICVFGEIQEEHDKEDLLDIARQIADKLKCSPLAAKTVGRLLSKKPYREHWMEILEKKEWLKQKHDDDIIPALKISYDYLPFHLKKCFSYCALFPEDYKFNSLEITRFWISVGIIDSNGQNDKIEDIGSKYLDELLDNGFLMKGDDTYYVMHDLLHELSQSVSSKECAYISCSSFRADDIPPSIRHLSISMQDNYTEIFEEEMNKLKRRINIGSLQSLMIFGEYRRASLVNILKHTFKEIKGLRVLFIFINSINSLPHNFSKLVHLRYLKVKSPRYSKVCLPSVVSRFYHLKFLDLQHWGRCYDMPKDIIRLVNLRHFVVANKEFHSNVSEVGKMKFLQELKGFHVKKEHVGFELKELGQLEELGGELNIYGLENVRIREEANEAKLMAKRNIIKLGLFWGREQQFRGDDILDSLQPHSNLRELRIVNHGGATCPSWLCSNIHMKNLESLHLERVSWATLLPFGQIYHLRKLKLKNIVGICQFGPDIFGGITEKSFTQLKEVEFDYMPELVEWVGGANSHFFSRLERIRCTNCPKLVALPFSGWFSSSTQDNTIWFANLCHLYIHACPKLRLPPLPHTSMLSSVHTDYLDYDGTELHIKMPSELAFHNLGEIDVLEIKDTSLISFTDLQKLRPLRSIRVRRCEETLWGGLDDSFVLHSVQYLELREFPLTGKSLSNLFKCFPALSSLDVCASDEDHEEVVLQFPFSSSLRDVRLVGCKNLILPVEDEGGFRSLSSLVSVYIQKCGKLFSRWSMGEAAQSINLFPPCLKELLLREEPSMMSMALLSNLTSLTTLALVDCKNTTVDGFNPLITSNLETLWVNNRRDDETGGSIAADLLAEVARTKIMPAGSFQLTRIEVDSISAVLVGPICRRLSASLRTLYLQNDWRAESFTEEQDEALQFLTSLREMHISDCRALQSLPQGLHCLSSLEGLYVLGSPKIRSLPKKGLPDSLQFLYIYDCCAELYEECQKLRGTRPDICVDTSLRTAED